MLHNGWAYRFFATAGQYRCLAMAKLDRCFATAGYIDASQLLDHINASQRLDHINASQRTHARNGQPPSADFVQTLQKRSAIAVENYRQASTKLADLKKELGM